jgi:protein-S-isoprenylcysteine O-methyltransferase Ste14
MTVPQLAVLLAACACFASYAWGLARFFRRAAADSSNYRLITWATAASVIAQASTILLFYRHGSLRFAGAMALYAVALGMFWWCIRVNRARPLSLAFSTDAPDHLVVAGPYAAVRHPFYVSYLLCWVAGVVATRCLPLLATVALMAWVYHRAALQEEAKFAASPLAEAYARYAATTGRYLPRIAPRRGRR